MHMVTTINQEREAAQRLRTAFDMHEFGVEMMRQQLIRELGANNRKAINQRLQDWLATQPAKPEAFFRARAI